MLQSYGASCSCDFPFISMEITVRSYQGRYGFKKRRKVYLFKSSLWITTPPSHPWLYSHSYIMRQAEKWWHIISVSEILHSRIPNSLPGTLKQESLEIYILKNNNNSWQRKVKCTNVLLNGLPCESSSKTQIWVYNGRHFPKGSPLDLGKNNSRRNCMPSVFFLYYSF